MSRGTLIVAGCCGLVCTLALAVGCGDDPTPIQDSDPELLFNPRIESRGGIQVEPLAIPERNLRILFILDRSQSMAVSDPLENGQCGVVSAVEAVVNSHTANARVMFGILRFGSQAACLTDAGGCFTRRLDLLRDSLYELAQVGGTTDYQDALELAAQVIEDDLRMQAASGGHRITKYVLVFLSDGLPFPQDSETGWNTPEAVVGAVETIMALREAYPEARVRLHTFFLASTGMPTDVTAEVEALLEEMAEAGHGTYRRFDSGTEIDFEGLDFLP
jgi:uncharacterized protein YegL